MTIALLTHVTAAGLNGATSGSIDTTGASLLVIAVAYGGTITVSDSKSNTWTALTEYANSGQKQRIYYAANPTVGAGHTFTVSGTGVVAAFAASSWSGVDTTSPFDVGSGASGATLVTGAGMGSASLTPAANGALVLDTCSHAVAVSGVAGANGFTLLDAVAFSSGVNYGLGASYVIQTTAATVSNATVVLSWTTGSQYAIASAVFKAATGSAATATTLTGPSGGINGVASTNFTVGANGTITGTITITPSDGGGGGTFTPTTVNISSGTPTATFTYTPASVGAKTISIADNGGLTDATPLTYTVTSAGSPTSGTASLSSATATTINVTCGAASGGAAPLTYQWHRSTTANFTPSGGTLLSGATSLTLADSAGLAAATPYYYKLRVTDNASATADSNEIAGVLKASTLVLGFVGDSITMGNGLSAGLDPATKVGTILANTYRHRAVTVSNQAVNGSKTSQWVTGQANLTAAKSAFSSAGVTHVHIMLGANDAAAANLVSAVTYGSNLANICSDLTGAGYTVILSYPTYIPAGANSNATTAASVALTQAYQAQIDALINGTTILRGDTLAHRYFIDTLSEYQADLTHPTATGAQALAVMWARAIDRALNKRSGGYSRAVTVTLTSDGTTPRASLSGLRWAFWDEAKPDLMACPADSGTGETTDASGGLVINIASMLPSGGVGWLVVTDSDGTTTQSPAHKAFSGPVTVS